MSTSTPTQAKYYTINEESARRAKAMNSFSDYTPGSATAEYRRMVDEAAEIAERQKKRPCSNSSVTIRTLPGSAYVWITIKRGWQAWSGWSRPSGWTRNYLNGCL